LACIAVIRLASALKPSTSYMSTLRSEPDVGKVESCHCQEVLTAGTHAAPLSLPPPVGGGVVPPVDPPEPVPESPDDMPEPPPQPVRYAHNKKALRVATITLDFIETGSLGGIPRSSAECSGSGKYCHYSKVPPLKVTRG
jgi:hypothetical protein